MDTTVWYRLFKLIVKYRVHLISPQELTEELRPMFKEIYELGHQFNGDLEEFDKHFGREPPKADIPDVTEL